MRPHVCRKYQCAWSQGITSEHLRPDLSGVLVSVEIDDNGHQFLKAMDVIKNPSCEIYDEIAAFVKTHHSYYVRIDHEGRLVEL